MQSVHHLRTLSGDEVKVGDEKHEKFVIFANSINLHEKSPESPVVWTETLSFGKFLPPWRGGSTGTLHGSKCPRMAYDASTTCRLFSKEAGELGQ